MMIDYAIANNIQLTESDFSTPKSILQKYINFKEELSLREFNYDFYENETDD